MTLERISRCRNSGPHRRARCLGLRRSVLRYSELPSSGRSCCITAQGEDELSDMPTRKRRGVGSFVGSERELGPDSQQGRCDTRTLPRAQVPARGRPRAFFELNLNLKARF